MIYKIFYKIFLCLLCGLCFFVIVFSSNLYAVKKLELALQVDKTEFAIGEPIVIYASLKNTDRDVAKVVGLLKPDFGFVDYLITDPKGKESKFKPWALKENPSPLIQLAPEESRVAEIKIFFGAGGWTFTEPGKYKIKAIYMNQVSSNSLDISISAPQDEAAKKAADLFLNSKEVGFFLLFEGGDHLEEGKRIIEQVAEQFPNSPLASYSNYVLGANLMNDFANFEKNRLQHANPEKALKYLERAKAHPSSLYQVLHTHLYLEEAYMKTGKPEQVMSVQQDLMKITSERFPDFNSIIDVIKRERK
ncbi:MAG: tetratricopeptide repeat protein [Candidatus Omnitrophota bacterium]